MNDLYIVYVKTDESSNIIDVNSSAFLLGVTGWVKIDEGEGDRYYHAQGNYFEKPIITEKGVYRYRHLNGFFREKTAEEIAAEEAAQPKPIPSTESDLMSMAIDHEYRLLIIETGV